MSLRAFNGSIANPAQTNINLGTNSLSNATNIGATGAITGGQLNLSNANYSQTINFSSTNPLAGATGFISFSGFQDKLSVDANLSEFNGPVHIISAGTNAAIETFPPSGAMSAVGAIFRGSTGGAAPLIRFQTYSGAGNVGQITFDTSTNEMVVDNNTVFQNLLDSNVRCSFQTSNYSVPLNMVYNTSNGTRISTYAGENTYIFGEYGATGATPYLKVDGVLGEGRVYDTVYNPLPTVQTYGQFSMNTTQGVGSTGGTAGVADTATQLLLDTDVISEGCSLTNGGIEVLNTGKYMITVSPQFYNTGSGNHNVYFWFRVNSTDVANSSTGVYLQGNAAQTVPTVSVVLDLTSADVVKIMAASDDSNIQALNVASQSSPYSRPAAPAIIATIVRLA